MRKKVKKIFDSEKCRFSENPNAEEKSNKISDLCHTTGKIHGAAHTFCNVNAERRFSSFIPKSSHNLTSFGWLSFDKEVFSATAQIILSLLVSHKNLMKTLQVLCEVDQKSVILYTSRIRVLIKLLKH